MSIRKPGDWGNQGEWDTLRANKQAKEKDLRQWQDKLLEAVLTDQEKQKVKNGGEVLDVNEAEKRRYLLNLIKTVEDIPSIYHLELVDQLLDEMYRHGPLEPLWQRKRVSDIQVFVPFDPNDKPIITYVENGVRYPFIEPGFASFDAGRDWVNKHLARIGLRFDPSKVLIDGMLPGGERINVVWGPTAYSKYNPILNEYEFVRCMMITIRRFIASFTLDELTEESRGQHGNVEFDSKSILVDAEVQYKREPIYTRFTGTGIVDRASMDYLRIMMQLKKNHLISGGTGSGKTTVANALCSMVTDLLLVIEESPEMQPQVEGHVIRLWERKGIFEQTDALKNALRMFPDRIFIAELRDKIAYTFIHAIQSGHDGSSSTIHASSCQGAVDRTIEYAASDPSRPSREMLRSILYERLHTVVHCNRESGDRFIDEICQLRPDGTLHTVSKFVKKGTDGNGKPIGYFEFTGPTDEFVKEMLINGIQIPSSWMWRRAQ